MKSERDVRKDEHQDILNSLNDLKGKTGELQVAIETEKNQREAEVKELRAKIESVEKRMHNFTPPGLAAATDDASREKQVIVSGFEEQDEQSIVEILKYFKKYWK